MTVGIFGTVFVVLAVLVIVLISVTGNKATPKHVIGNGMKIAPASVVNAIRDVSPASFAAAGSTVNETYGPFPTVITSIKKQPALVANGKPEVLYVGSNFCPYCAATRWPLVVALARFGTFTGLRITLSGPSPEAYPSTPTVSFYGSKYTSRYITFSATEHCTNVLSSSDSLAVRECNGYEPLEQLSKTVAKIFTKYDAPPCVPAADDGSIPFIDFGNKLFACGAFLNPTILGGFTQVQVAQSLSNPLASPAQTILAGANFYSAIICSLTGDQPKSVCTMPVVKQAAAQLKL
jgi:thiol-disulfide isomerase/thioredoxin